MKVFTFFYRKIVIQILTEIYKDFRKLRVFIKNRTFIKRQNFIKISGFIMFRVFIKKHILERQFI